MCSSDLTRGLTITHWGLARLLLARFRSEDLGAEVQRVGVAQRAAIAAEDNALRRLERDIHDGPQQRLLRLQMEDRIELYLHTESAKLSQATARHRDYIKAETLVARWGDASLQGEGVYNVQVSVDGQLLQISLRKLAV